MKRTLLVGAAVVGAFLLGGVAGIAFVSKAYAYEFKTRCLAVFEDTEITALSRMRFIAEGHTDWVYNLAEDSATGCATQTSVNLVKERERCIARLKIFYDHYPDRKAALWNRLPDVARALGYTTGS